MSDQGFVTAENVFVNVDVATKEEALSFLAEKGAELGIGESADAIYQAFLNREELGPTGLEAGLAIPHAKSDVINRPAVCLAKFVHPLEWESMDDEPISVAVTLYVPGGEAGTTHVRLLSKVAVLASRDGFAEFIYGSDDPAEIAAYLSEGISL